MNSKKHLNTRAKVAVAGGSLLAVIGLMGIMMGWSLYYKTFSTYPKFFQNVFALGTALVIEGALFWFGVQLIKSAATWAERGFALFAAVSMLAIIGVNIATHNTIARGANLSPWQFNYLNYFGPAVIVVIALFVIVQLVLRPEVQESFRDAMREFETKERVDGIEDEVLQSEEFEVWIKTNFKDEMFRRAAGRAGYDSSRHAPLPAADRKQFQPPTVEGQLIDEPQLLNGKATDPKEMRH